MRYLLISLFCLLSGCSCNDDSGKSPEKSAEICSKVTNENWYTVQWGNVSSQDLCNKHWYVFYNDGNESTLPCTFGGMPFICHSHSKEEWVNVLFLTETNVITIFPEDRARVGDGLKIIR